MAERMSVDEMAFDIKTANPDEAAEDNRTLVARFLREYPEHAARVDMSAPPRAESGLLRALPAAVGGAALGLAAGPVGLPAGMALSALGAGGGEALRQLAARALGRGGPETPTAAAREIRSAALGGAAGELGGRAVFAAARRVVPPLVKRAAGLMSGITSEAFERAAARPRTVLSAVSREPEAAKDFADVFKASITSNLEAAGDAYEQLIQSVLTGQKYGPGFKLPLFRDLSDGLVAIQKKYGFALPNRLGAPAAQANEFMRVNRTIQGMKSAGLEDVYYFQRDLNNMIRDNAGTTLGAALREVKDRLMIYLGKSVPEIGAANKIYAKAVTLSQKAEKEIFNKQDIPSAVKSAYARRTTLRDTFEQIGNEIPAARQALEALRDATAGQEFAPAIAGLPRTGLMGALLGLGGVSMGTRNPAFLLPAIAAAPFASPRLVGTMIRGGTAAAPALARGARAGGAGAGGAVGVLMSAPNGRRLRVAPEKVEELMDQGYRPLGFAR